MGLTEAFLLVGVGLLSGGINAVVGGGTFFSFPVLLAFGLPPVIANATSTVALWPASAMAARAYLPELKRVREVLLLRAVVAFVGGTVGAFLLLASGNALFFSLVPWLLAGATLLFAFAKPLVRQVAKFSRRANAALMLGLQFLFAIYGGYFGAGVGILFMAALALGGESNAQIANAQKNLLATCINGAAVAIFVARSAVNWPVAIAVMAGAIVGGYCGARAARSIPADWLRVIVIIVGCVLSAIYFRTVYFG